MPARWPSRPNDPRYRTAARRHAQLVARQSWSRQSPPAAEPPTTGGPSLYETVLRQAIAAQHGISPSERLELRACAGCSKPYLLASLWQPLSEEGAIACPRCGEEAVTWDGARGYVAYWQREGGHLPGTRIA